MLQLSVNKIVQCYIKTDVSLSVTVIVSRSLYFVLFWISHFASKMIKLCTVKQQKELKGVLSKIKVTGNIKHDNKATVIFVSVASS